MTAEDADEVEHRPFETLKPYHALARTRRGRPATPAGDATLAAFADGGGD